MAGPVGPGPLWLRTHVQCADGLKGPSTRSPQESLSQQSCGSLFRGRDTRYLHDSTDASQRRTSALPGQGDEAELMTSALGKAV